MFCLFSGDSVATMGHTEFAELGIVWTFVFRCSQLFCPSFRCSSTSKYLFHLGCSRGGVRGAPYPVITAVLGLPRTERLDFQPGSLLSSNKMFMTILLMQLQKYKVHYGVW